jgi:lipopolysaccharide export system permease protein
MAQWRIFEFDREFRLRSISTADEGVYVGDSGERAWRLTNFVETRVPLIGAADTAPTPLRTEVIREPVYLWRTDLSPEIFGVLLVQPERMRMIDLAQYIQHLIETRQRADRYQVAFWGKVFHPLAILVMMALALPFAYLHVRQGSVSLKIFAGTMLGVGAFMINKLVVHMGTLNTWPPVLVAALPNLVIMSAALAALYWIERR